MLCLSPTSYFNPRSHEGSDATTWSGWWISTNFNPRSHEGSDRRGLKRRLSATVISIHAPTRGATVARSRRPPRSSAFQSTLPRGERQGRRPAGRSAGEISIHAPTRGATLPSRSCIRSSARFQSTLPRGERHLLHQATGRGVDISIHAPTRGAT